MIESILKGFEVWTNAQGVKSRGRVRSIENISLEGIARLRELILNLAISGKLVPQDSSEESAETLITKISITKTQKEEVAISSKFKLINKNEEPFNIPENWVWTRLGEIVEMIYGSSLTKAECIEGAPYPVYGSNGIIGYYDKFLTDKRTIIVGRKGSAGALNVCHVPSWTTDVAYYIEESPHLNFDFLFYLIKSLRLESLGKGIKPGVNRNEAYVVAVPLPPLKEQRRIVSKIEELMALCDRLEEEQTNNLTTHYQLVKSLLGTLTQAKDADVLHAAWEKLAEHFDMLFCTEESIEQLKQTLLQLAVMGRLIKPDSNDEPANELIRKIISEKTKLINSGVLKSEKDLAEIDDEEKPFLIPRTWQWVRLGSIAILSGGFAYKSPLFIDDSPHQVIRMGNIRPDYLRLDENPVFISEKYGDETSNYKIEVNDILLTMTGTKDKKDFLYSLIINKQNLTNKTLYLNQRLCSLRTILILPEFINKVLKDDRILDSIFAQSTGTANQANIGMTALKNWVIPLPPLKEQDKILKRIEELFSICDRLSKKIIKSNDIKNSLSKAIIENIIL